MLHRVSILAVGTELTTGQVTNRNAAWISERLSDLGLEVVLHETVPDEHGAIEAALERCAAVGQSIFVTGGLGPTSDDFTREVVAKWLSAKLEFHEPSWLRIVKRLEDFGIRVAESNRQQCYFPPEAVILENPEGTANGFSVTRGATRLWILPGPPREIEAIWDFNGLPGQVARHCPGLKKRKLWSWQCLGKSEAELGEITENALLGSGLLTGYRAHRPYIEIKVWSEENPAPSQLEAIRRLEQAIAPWWVASGEQDLAQELLAKLGGATSVRVIDSATAGILSERLGQVLRTDESSPRALNLVSEFPSVGSHEVWVRDQLAKADEGGVTLVLAGISEKGEWVLGLRRGAQIRQEVHLTPIRSAALMDRSRRFVAEMAMKVWGDWLRD